MAAFYDTHPFVVQPEKASSGKANYWNILNPGGVKLAIMHHTPDPLPLKILRAMGVAANFGTLIRVEDTQGRPIMSFRKSFSFGMFKASVYDEAGELLGRVTEKKLGLQGRTYVLSDAQGKMQGSLAGDWRAYSLQMHDARGSTIGKISRKSEDINKVIFTEKSAFYVVHLYIPQPDGFRKLLLGTAAAMALLLR